MDETPTPPINQPHTVVISIDGLRAAALGAFGNTAHETPTFDVLAIRSCVWDWCYADTPDQEALLSELSVIASDQAGQASLFVSDDAQVLALPLAQRFAEQFELEAEPPIANAATIGETSTAQTWAGFAQALASWRESHNDTRLFAWLHTRGMYGPWDGPCELFESLVDEDDPPIEPSIVPPDTQHQDASSTDACEARFAASCRYAGQVMALDACLGGWLDVVEGMFEGEELRIILLGTRGFPLGEHGRVGGVDDRLFSEQQQVPLLATAIDPRERFTRVNSPTTLTQAVAQLFGSPLPTSEVLLRAPSGARALRNDEWLLRVGGAEENPTALPSEELYVKPDDRWEQNDVASLRPAEVEELLATIAEANSKS